MAAFIQTAPACQVVSVWGAVRVLRWCRRQSTVTVSSPKTVHTVQYSKVEYGTAEERSTVYILQGEERERLHLLF